MAVRVIDRFEVIEIDEQNAELVSETRRAVNLGLKRLVEMARVVESSAVVGDGQFLDLLDPARILDGDGCVVAERLEEEKLRLRELRHVHVDQLNDAQDT